MHIYVYQCIYVSPGLTELNCLSCVPVIVVILFYSNSVLPVQNQVISSLVQNQSSESNFWLSTLVLIFKKWLFYAGIKPLLTNREVSETLMISNSEWWVLYCFLLKMSVIFCHLIPGESHDSTCKWVSLQFVFSAVQGMINCNYWNIVLSLLKIMILWKVTFKIVLPQFSLNQTKFVDSCSMKIDNECYWLDHKISSAM